MPLSQLSKFKPIQDKGNLNYAMGIILELLELIDSKDCYEISKNQESSSLIISEISLPSSVNKDKFNNALQRLSINECFDLSELDNSTQYQLTNIDKKTLVSFLGLGIGANNVDKSSWAFLFESTS
ncbi:MAG: hypothetical protein LCH30_07130, partial [Proteobacteria bacterium]|nr:hypothetical protein [Pseudomonadota bacterium]